MAVNFTLENLSLLIENLDPVLADVLLALELLRQRPGERQTIEYRNLPIAGIGNGTALCDHVRELTNLKLVDWFQVGAPNQDFPFQIRINSNGHMAIRAIKRRRESESISTQSAGPADVPSKEKATAIVAPSAATANARSRVPCAVILTALPVEYKAVVLHLTDLTEDTHPSGTVYQTGAFYTAGTSWTVAVAEIGAGNIGAAQEAERAIARFKPEVILFVGVAGGVKDVGLYDVVAATKIYGYESGKAKEQFEPRPELGESSSSLIHRARAEARKPDWLQRIKDGISGRTPTAWVVPIAAGEKVVTSTRSAVHMFIRSQYGDAVAVEMEGHGFLKAANANEDVKALVVRGISDLIDDKNAPVNEEMSDQEKARIRRLAERRDAKRQQIAARNASAFVFEVLAKLNPVEEASTNPT